MTDSILFQRAGHLARLILNDPERHNALGGEALRAIMAHLDHVAAEEGVRVLIVTGTGDKTFCAGASLRELGAGDLRDEIFQQMTARLAALSVPTICAMNGDVFGGGAELAASCDFRIGIEGMRMRVPAASLGLCYPVAGMRRLVECLGVGAARRILVASEEFDTEALLEIGFLDHVVLPVGLEEATADLAEHIAGLAPLAVQSMKMLLRQLAAGELDERMAADLVSRCAESEDLQEGLAAQREKRKPRFAGR